jgi:ABC-type polysaccharide/polyol phosphate export permease
MTSLPSWARKAELVNPVAQVMQDARFVILSSEPRGSVVTAADAFGMAGRIVPIGVAVCVFVVGYLLFSRQEPWFAERT